MAWDADRLPLAQLGSQGQREVVSDCKGVSTGWAKLRRMAQANAGSIGSVNWTKAHTDTEQCTSDQEMHDWVGNIWADGKAKEAARMYRYEKEQLEAYVEKAKMLMATAAAMAAMQAAWPGLRELYQLPLREPRVRQRTGRAAGADHAKAHEYRWITRSLGGNAWKCTRCFHTKAAVGGKGTKATPCITAERPLAKLLRGDHSGHKLFVAVTAGSALVVLCSACGRYAEQHVRMLGQPCVGCRTTASAKQAFTRFFGPKPRHPQPKVKALLLAGPWRAHGPIPESAAEHKGWILRAFEPMEAHQARAAEVSVAATGAVIASLTQLEEDHELDEQQGFFSGFEGLDWGYG